jgi:hypothetical protein
MAHQRGQLVISGPTAGSTDPRAACGPGALLGPSHEEKGVIWRASHGGRGRRKIGEHGGDSLE